MEKFKKLFHTVKLYTVTGALALSGAFYSCTDPNEDIIKPKPDPENPTEKTTYKFSAADMPTLSAKVDSIVATSKNSKNSVAVDIQKPMAAGATDITKVMKPLYDAQKLPNVSLSLNGNYFHANKQLIDLDSVQTYALAEVISVLPVKGKTVSGASQRFQINEKFADLFTGSIRNELAFAKSDEPTLTDEKVIVIDDPKRVSVKISEAIAANNDPAIKTVRICFTKDIKTKLAAWSGVDYFLRNVKYHSVEKLADKQIARGNSKYVLEKTNGITITVSVNKEVILDSQLTKFWGWPFEDLINLDVRRPSGAGEAAITVARSDSLAHMYATRKTAAFKDKATTHPNLVFNVVFSYDASGRVEMASPYLAEYVYTDAPYATRTTRGTEIKYRGKLPAVMAYGPENGGSAEYIIRTEASTDFLNGLWTTNSMAVIEDPENVNVVLNLPNDKKYEREWDNKGAVYYFIEQVHTGELQKTLGIVKGSNAKITLNVPRGNIGVYGNIIAIESFAPPRLVSSAEMSAAIVKYLNANNVYVNADGRFVGVPAGSSLHGAKYVPFAPNRTGMENVR